MKRRHIVAGSATTFLALLIVGVVLSLRSDSDIPDSKAQASGGKRYTVTVKAPNPTERFMYSDVLLSAGCFGEPTPASDPAFLSAIKFSPTIRGDQFEDRARKPNQPNAILGVFEFDNEDIAPPCTKETPFLTVNAVSKSNHFLPTDMVTQWSDNAKEEIEFIVRPPLKVLLGRKDGRPMNEIGDIYGLRLCFGGENPFFAKKHPDAERECVRWRLEDQFMILARFNTTERPWLAMKTFPSYIWDTLYFNSAEGSDLTLEMYIPGYTPIRIEHIAIDASKGQTVIQLGDAAAMPKEIPAGTTTIVPGFTPTTGQYFTPAPARWVEYAGYGCSDQVPNETCPPSGGVSIRPFIGTMSCTVDNRDNGGCAPGFLPIHELWSERGGRNPHSAMYSLVNNSNRTIACVPWQPLPINEYFAFTAPEVLQQDAFLRMNRQGFMAAASGGRPVGLRKFSNWDYRFGPKSCTAPIEKAKPLITISPEQPSMEQKLHIYVENIDPDDVITPGSVMYDQFCRPGLPADTEEDLPCVFASWVPIDIEQTFANKFDKGIWHSLALFPFKDDKRVNTKEPEFWYGLETQAFLDSSNKGTLYIFGRHTESLTNLLNEIVKTEVQFTTDPL